MNVHDVNVIIFSKNRACQLHACLESFYTNFKSATSDPNVTVIWTASNDRFKAGYEKLKLLFSTKNNLKFVRETSFKENVTQAVKNGKWNKFMFTMFLVDDLIFVDKVDLQNDPQFQMLSLNPQLVAVSLRLHSNVSYCYAEGREQEIPKFVKGCVWSWRDYTGDWGYPMSVDGNIYNTDFLKPFCELLNYNNPNLFEASLDSAVKVESMPSYMCCYPSGPRLINIPTNRVQNVVDNRFENTTFIEELNEMYLQGKEIDVDLFHGLKPNSVHCPLEIKFRG